MEVVGEGAYGCVHKPSLRCSEHGVDYNHSLSKILPNEDADDEVQKYAEFHEIDPANKFHLGTPYRCRPAATNQNIVAIGKCPDKEYGKQKQHLIVNGELNPNVSLLVMKDGGVDLHKFSNHQFSELSIPEVEDFWMAAHMLFNAIIAASANDIVLVDLKPDNMVYEAATKKLALIDFGLMNTREYLFENPRFPHWSYPVEANFYNNKHSDPEQSTKFNTLWSGTFNSTVNRPRSRSFYFRKNFLASVLPDENDADEEFTGKGMYARLQADLKKLARDAKARVFDYATFYAKSVDTFDLYCVGMTLLECLRASKDKLRHSHLNYKTLQRLLYACITPDILERFTMEEALEAYEDFLQPLMQARNLKFVGHNILANQKPCPPGKRLNRANRCIKIPVPKCPAWKEWNSDHTKCVTRCSEYQERTPHSTRCVKKCNPYQDRLGNVHAALTKGRNRCVTVKCPEGKSLNSATKRCRKI